jgi:predicted RNA-binding Zn ribbon-like protein
VAQIKGELAAYPLFEYLAIAMTTRSFDISRSARGYRQTAAPLRGRISETVAVPYRSALDWFALAGLVQAGIRLGVCPDPDCRKFFIDAKRRGKKACSSACALRLRVRKHYDTLKANTRKYAAYKKRQAKLMRERRAAGLA